MKYKIKKERLTMRIFYSILILLTIGFTPGCLHLRVTEELIGFDLEYDADSGLAGRINEWVNGEGPKNTDATPE